MPKDITFDWDKIDAFLVAGCTGRQVAAEMGIHEDTLYNRTKLEKGILFSEYSAQKYSKGDARLIASQYNSAIKGNTTMLIHLGKHRLGQKDKESNIEDEFRKHLRNFATERSKNNNSVSDPPQSIGPCLEDQQSILHQECSGESNPISNELGPTTDL